jgi:long-chain fatty acid transport protein
MTKGCFEMLAIVSRRGEIMNQSKTIIALTVMAALAAMSGSALAGGFGLATQSGSGTGNAFAGGAAAAEDASVAWSNPAAMTALPSGNQLTAAGHFLRPSFKFSNAASTGAFAAPGTGEGGDAGDWAFVPNLFFTTDVNPRLRLGVAVNAPFGLKTDYDSGWRGQLTGLKSEINSININPSVAYKLSDTVSIGGGVSVQKFKAELTGFAGSAAAGNVKINADDTGYGFNLGLLAQASPNTRFGVTYRSSIKYDLGGTASFSGAAAALLGSNVTASLRVPESASASFFTALNPKWDVMGDITWTRWSQIQQLDIIRTTANGVGNAAGSTLSSLAFRWSDTWRFGIGANYKASDQMKFRFGLAFDRTPTNDANRTPRLPDQDRTWAAVGVQYRVSKAGMLELGYAHEFVRDAAVNVPVPGLTTCAAGCLTGNFNDKADIVSIQYSHLF